MDVATKHYNFHHGIHAPFHIQATTVSKMPGRHEGAPEVVLYYNRHTKLVRAITPGECRYMAWAKKIECCRCSYALNNGTHGAIFNELHLIEYI